MSFNCAKAFESVHRELNVSPVRGDNVSRVHRAVHAGKKKPLFELLHAYICVCELTWPPSCLTLAGVVVFIRNGPSLPPFAGPAHPPLV